MGSLKLRSSTGNHHNPLLFVPIAVGAGGYLGVQRGGGDWAAADAADGFRLPCIFVLPQFAA